MSKYRAVQVSTVKYRFNYRIVHESTLKYRFNYRTEQVQVHYSTGLSTVQYWFK